MTTKTAVYYTEDEVREIIHTMNEWVRLNIALSPMTDAGLDEDG